VNVRKVLIIDLVSSRGMNIFSNAITAPENTTTITNITLIITIIIITGVYS